MGVVFGCRYGATGQETALERARGISHVAMMVVTGASKGQGL